MNYSRTIAPAVMGALLLITSTACRNHDQVPVYNNAPAPTPVPLTVHGRVVDTATTQPIPGATVRITHTTGVALATLTADASGAFGLDVTGLTDTELNVSATAAGYGYGAAVATLDATNNTSSVPVLTLTQLTATAVSANAGGTTGSAAGSGEAENSTPITITIPAGAVAADTPLTFSALPVDQVPLIPNADTEVLLGAMDVGPASTAFAVDAQLTLPLPVTLPSGTPLNLLRLDSATGQWVLLSQAGAVNADGVTANVNVGTGGTFGLTLSGITASGLVATPGGLNPVAADEVIRTSVAAPLAVVTPPPPAPVSLTSGSATVSGVDIWDYTITQTGTFPFKQTFLNRWLSAITRSMLKATKTTSMVVVFPNLTALHLVDSAGRQIPPPGGVVPGRYTYTVTFAYTTKVARTITLGGGPPRFPSAWSITATNTHTYLTQSGVLTWGAFTGVTGGV